MKNDNQLKKVKEIISVLLIIVLLATTIYCIAVLEGLLPNPLSL
jgi:hypothetical protein